MKALVLKEYNHFSYEDVPVPEINDDEVLVEIKACAICGSDVHGMDGSTGRRVPPIIMGHEASGVIVRTGSRAVGYKAGDRVTFDSTLYCGECAFCKRGEINLCDKRKVLGVSCDEYRMNGALAQFAAIPARILYPLPEGISFENAAMVEPLSIAWHALARTKTDISTNAAILGSGIIGLLIIRLLKLAGCRKIIAVDNVRSKLDMALEFGADNCLEAGKADIPAEIRSLTGGFGADTAFEAVGIQPTFTDAVACLRKGGELVLVGNVKPSLEFPLQSVVTRQIRISGSCASAGEYPECLDLISSGRVDPGRLISAVAPLSEGGTWFRKLYNKEPGLLKVVLVP
ncbi:MAG: galactitol-1-phosphate 5-dehydrogenase [Eubacteriales bacterium]|nr:galactitol-1-phosphate 5-dehydrogenase [Eubacteriales bacterium]